MQPRKVEEEHLTEVPPIREQGYRMFRLQPSHTPHPSEAQAISLKHPLLFCWQPSEMQFL